MYFRGFIYTFLLAFSFNLFAQNLAEEKCSDALIQLFETDSFAKDHMQKFLKLQADLTLHKLAYSMYRNSMTVERFKIEDEILKLLNELDNPNPEFKAIKEKFEGNKLSRTRLAQIMPYLKGIINDQLNEKDPYKRKTFLIGESDLKILSVLADSEFQYDSGRYIDKYVSSHLSSSSVFNMLRIINSAMEKNDKVEGDVRKNLANRIQDIQTQMVNFMDQLVMPWRCKRIYASCRFEHRDDAILDEDFVSLMMDVAARVDGLDSARYLRYGEIDLVMDQTDRKVKLLKKTKKEQNDVSISAASKKTTDAKTVQDYLIQHVLDHIPYFVTRKELEADPELLGALAKAIDAGVLNQTDKEKRIFHYKGDEYYLPELWNEAYTGNRLVQQFKKRLNESIAKIEDFFTSENDFEIPKEIEKKKHDDFERIRNEQFFIFKKQLSFEFEGKLYDIHTGKLINADLTGLLSFKKGMIPGGSGDENQVDPAMDNRKAHAIVAGERSYIMDDEVYHISDQPVDIDLEYNRFKSHIQSTDVSVNSTATKSNLPTKQSILNLEQIEPQKYALVIKAITDRKRAFTYDGNVYDLLSSRPFEPLSQIQKDDVMADFRTQNGLTQRKNATGQNISAILNDDPVYEEDGSYFNSISGRKLANRSEVIEIEDGYFEHDQIFSNESKLNEQENEVILKEYFKTANAKSCEYHTILDKKNAQLKVYDSSGKLVKESEVLLGKPGDKHIGDQTPAGIVYTDIGDGMAPSYLPHLDFKSIGESSIKQMVALNNGSIADNYQTSGSVYLDDNSLSEYREKYHDNKCPIYVLPQRDDLKYKLRDGKLEFIANNQQNFSYQCQTKTKPCLGDFYLSDYDEFEAKDIRIHFEDLNLENNTSRAFASSLVKKKPELMQKLGLSNGEYNELAKMAIAVLGVESGFGSEKAYKLKEKKVTVPLVVPVGTALVPVGTTEANIGQTMVKTMKYAESLNVYDVMFRVGMIKKAFNAKDYTNSRGLTQIKDVRGFLKAEYPQITEESLNQPENAAIATMFVLAQKYKQLEYLKTSHPGITESNKFDYLYYIYSGSVHRIGTKNATPKMNQKSQELIAYASKIKILTK